MDFSGLKETFKQIGDFFDTLFSTYWGILILVVACLIISLLVAAILEKRTKKMYVDHPKNDDAEVEGGEDDENDKVDNSSDYDSSNVNDDNTDTNKDSQKEDEPTKSD